jgi:peptide-methionine (S)-S-oxide reductase
MNRFILLCLLGGLIMLGIRTVACAAGKVDYRNFPDPKEDLKIDPKAGEQKVVLAGGCFWCTEGVFEKMPGVTNVVSGYSGGSKENANYEAVCNGDTGHAEAIQITYDPAKTSYGKLLKAFFSIAHDPTELDYQGPDHGKQYRSAIFYASDDQKRVAEAYIKQLDDAKVFDSKIVTTLEPLKEFYPAENYHQNFFRLNPNHPYIRQQAAPKVEKAEKAAEIEKEKATTQPAKEG